MTKDEFLQKVSRCQPTVFILRGIPGAGKSTVTEAIWNKFGKAGAVCSADHYWLDDSGKYCFDLAKVPQNHHYCLREFCKLAFCGYLNIFLDNTNTTVSEFSHYVKIAEAYGYKTYIVTLNVSVETSLKRNVHQVPEKTIRGMFERLNDPDNNLKLARFCREHKIEHFNIDTE
jgi:tRNA uridine 5-carbamoylmethylation protein Kti12